MIRIGNKVVAGSVELDLSTVLKSLNKTGLSVWVGTQTEHDALAESVKNNEKTTFITYDTDEDIYLIIDTIVSYGKTWSSVKISSELAKKINASDVYTKEQVDEIINAKLTSALKYRGAVNTIALLPGSAENGDTYFVKADGFMYAYNSTTSAWDALGTVADMANYFTKTEITAMLQDKADKFQYDVLSAASSETVGVLLQYTGANTEDYKNGYFYKGIDNGDNTYGWGLAKTGDYYSKSEADDSGLFAHGDNAPFLENSTITNYLTGLDAKYKFATFTVDQDNATVSDKVNTTQWFSYNCYRQNTSWRVIATDSETGKNLYTTDISAGSSVSWSKLATQSELADKVDYKLVVESGSRYVGDIVTQEINNWLPNDNSSILINLKKLSGSNYANFQLLCNKQDSNNWSCIVSGAVDTLWKIRYANGVRYVDEIATKDSSLQIIQLSGAVDCNTLKQNALYVAASGAVTAVSNAPIDTQVYLNGGFSILVTNTNTESICYGMQMFIPYGSDVPFIRKSYYLHGQYWTSWEQVATKSDLTYIPIETNRTITFSSDYTSVTVYRCGYNSIRAHIEVDAQCNIATVNGWIEDMGIVLPEGYRPFENMTISAWCSSSTEYHIPVILTVGTNGKLSGYFGKSHTSIHRLCIVATYFK